MDSAVNVDEGLFVWRAIEACERLNGAMLPARESVSEANRANGEQQRHSKTLLDQDFHIDL